MSKFLQAGSQRLARAIHWLFCAVQSFPIWGKSLYGWELRWYCDSLRKRHALSFYRYRTFIAHVEWLRLSEHDYYRRHGVFRETHPKLGKVLQHRVALVLGEPGAGKTTEAHAAILEILTSEARECVPLYAHLRSYRGDLASLLSLHLCNRRLLTCRCTRGGKRIKRVFVLDGLDEIPPEFFHCLVEEVKEQLADDYTQVFLTSRQAFYEKNRNALAALPTEFHITDFDDEDIRAFVEHAAVSYERFEAEVRRADFEGPISNPFILNAAVKYFQRNGRLGETRHELVCHVIDELIASRPTYAGFLQRRALRMLAVATETYSRNELTADEAKYVLSQSMKLSDTQAESLLDELGHSILVLADDRLSFQIRAYGEYLAAEELSEADLGKIQNLVFFPGTRIPNDSWLNSVSYLVETHAEARRFFMHVHPEWVLPASPAVFGEDEKSELVRRILRDLVVSRLYLVRHPLIKHAHLARFLTQPMEAELVQATNSGNPVEAANAFVLLAHREHREICETAFAVAINQTRGNFLRQSAIVALANLGDRAFVPRLLEILSPEDSLRLSLVDAAGALIDEQDIATVLPVLQRTDAMVTSAFYRFRQFRSREALEAVLDYLIANPTTILGRRIDGYIEPVWGLIDRFWDEQIAAKLGRLFARWEMAGTNETEISALSRVVPVVVRRDAEGRVVRVFLGELPAERQFPFHMGETTGQILTADLARSLMEQNPPAAFLFRLVRRATPEVRAILRANQPWGTAAQVEEAPAPQPGGQQLTPAEKAIATKVSTILESQHYREVFNAFQVIPPEQWPDLAHERKAWLSIEVSQHFVALDCAANVVWHGDNRWTVPANLETVLKIVEHYHLRLQNDLPIIQSLVGWSAGPAADYYSHYGLSDEARAEFERLLGEPATTGGTLTHLLPFLDETDFDSPAMQEALARIAHSQTRTDYLRTRAVSILHKKGAADDRLLEIANNCQPPVSTEALDCLVARQHLPTIRRRLGQLLANDDEIRAGDVDFPEHSPLVWILSVKAEEAWDQLGDLRCRALTLSLPYMVEHLSRVLGRIDKQRLAGLVRQQLNVAPPGWQDSQRIRALEIQREATLERAQHTTFDSVIERMTANTTMKRFKLWCEGPHDSPVFKEFVMKAKLRERLEVVVHPVNGWANVLSDDYDPAPLADGCLDLMVVMDGDNGRNLTKPKRPTSKQGKKLQRKLLPLGIDLRILRRYGIENYFSQRSLEVILGAGLSAHFPLSETQPVNRQIPAFRKALNGQVAKKMSLDDLTGTDLGEVMDEMIRRAKF